MSSCMYFLLHCVASNISFNTLCCLNTPCVSSWMYFLLHCVASNTPLNTFFWGESAFLPAAGGRYPGRQCLIISQWGRWGGEDNKVNKVNNIKNHANNKDRNTGDGWLYKMNWEIIFIANDENLDIQNQYKSILRRKSFQFSVFLFVKETF